MEINRLMIGERIRAERERMKYTREYLAELIDVAPGFLAQLETGNNEMSIKTLLRLSEKLAISTDYIIKGTPQNAIGDFEIILEQLSSAELIMVYEFTRLIVQARTKIEIKEAE